MTIRLTLLCAGATAASREGRFGSANERLDDGGREKLARFELHGPEARRCFVAPDAAARETADLIGLDCKQEAALRDRNWGDWQGRGLSELPPDALAAWLDDPVQPVPGGEGMEAVVSRIGAWMDALGEGRALAITHAAVFRAAIAYALGVPVAGTMAIDVAPLSTVILSCHGRWRLQELRRA